MLELVNNLQQVFEERIKNLDWMSAGNKACTGKNKCLHQKFAIPINGKTMAITIDKKDFIGNVKRVTQWSYGNGKSFRQACR
jgi:putative endopeptidase